MICLVLALCLVLFSAGSSFGQANPTQTGPSRLKETTQHTYGPFTLKGQSLQQMAEPKEVIFPDDDVWLVGYHTEIVDGLGNRLPRELQCHSFLGSSNPHNLPDDFALGLFSDGYTESIQLPPGFGIFFKAGERLTWTPLFNNRNPLPVTASMRVRLDLIRARDLPQGLKPLTTTVRSVHKDKGSNMYMVPPGRDVRENTSHLPFVGKIHVMGAHLHPYGVSVELVNLTRGHSVWKAVGTKDGSGKLVKMPVYLNPEGYDVEAEEQFKVVAVYENPTEQPVDAMAGVFILYSQAETAP